LEKELQVSTGDSAQTKKPSREFVREYGKILFGAVLGIGSTLFVAWMNSKAPHLRFTPADTVVFQGDKDSFGIISCVVTNDGSALAEDVALSVDLAAPFREVKATPKSLQPEVTYEDPTTPMGDRKNPQFISKTKEFSAHVGVKTLNPGESFQVLATVNNPDALQTKRPVFVVRGKGIVGVETGETHGSVYSPLLSTLIGCFGGLVALTFMLFIVGVVSNIADGESGIQATKSTLKVFQKFVLNFLGRNQPRKSGD
jgi:hypothetical protein